jgi:hypothetical protein
VCWKACSLRVYRYADIWKWCGAWGWTRMGKLWPPLFPLGFTKLDWGLWVQAEISSFILTACVWQSDSLIVNNSLITHTNHAGKITLNDLITLRSQWAQLTPFKSGCGLKRSAVGGERSRTPTFSRPIGLSCCPSSFNFPLFSHVIGSSLSPLDPAYVHFDPAYVHFKALSPRCQTD